MVWEFTAREVPWDGINIVVLSGCSWPRSSFKQLFFEASPVELSWQQGLAPWIVAEDRIESMAKWIIKRMKKECVNSFTIPNKGEN